MIRRPASIRSDRGVTIAEMMVAVFLMTVVSIIFGTFMVNGFRYTKDLVGAAASNDDVRLAIQQIDREFRGAERICTPDAGVANAGDLLEFRTRAYAGSIPSAGYRDIAYELRDNDGDGQATDLMRSVDSGSWGIVVSGVTNSFIVDDDLNTAMGRPAGTAGVPLFEALGGAADSLPSEGKIVVVRLWIDADTSDHIGDRLETTEISGRNIWTPSSTGC